jgi:hypothetical protein
LNVCNSGYVLMFLLLLPILIKAYRKQQVENVLESTGV